MIRVKRNKKYLYALILFLVLGIGFAALAANLKINGTVNIDSASWDVHFENVQITQGSVTANPAPTSDDTTTTEMTYTINFTKPGDFYEFTVDMANDGSIDAMIELVANTTYESDGTTPKNLPSYLSSSVKYNDGGPIENNQLLAHGTSEKIKVRVEYRTDIDPNNLPDSSDTIVFKFTGDFKQKDDNAHSRYICDANKGNTIIDQEICTNNKNITIANGTVCKRAESLHQEICDVTSEGCLADGYSESGSKGTDVITYGSCGTQGTLASGDAFTCDVNGDNEFDELLERFYYISDYYDTTTKQFDSSTAVLLYYNNVTSGISCNANAYAYDESGADYNGPVTVMKQLPNTMQWSNVSLKSNTRAILAEYQSMHDYPTTRHGTLPTSFSYSGYSTRLLTAKELMAATNLSQVGTTTGSQQISGELSDYIYLFENTRFGNKEKTIGYRMETPSASLVYLDNPWIVSGYYRMVQGNYASSDSTGGGARPVIEVPKTSINY